MQNPEALFPSLTAQLRRFRRKLLLVDLAAASFDGVLAAVALGWCWVALEAALLLPPSSRAATGILAALLALATLIVQLARRVPGHLSVQKVALLIEERCPQLRQRLITSLELWENARSAKLFSKPLLRATLQRAVGDLNALDLRPLLGRRGLVHAVVRAGCGALVASGSLVLFGEVLGSAAFRCAHPLTAFEIEPRTRIFVAPGEGAVVKGDDFPIRIRFEGERPRSAMILSRSGDAATFARQRLLVGGADSLSFTFEEVKRSFSFMVEANDATSDLHQVAVIDPPFAEKIRLQYQYPPYSGLAPAIEEDTGDIRCLAGTRVEVGLFANKPLAAAALVVNDTVRIEADVADAGAKAGLTVESSGTYVIELRDRFGVSNSEPIRYSIHAVDDAYPQVDIAEPGRDMDLPDNMKVALGIEAADDFGISKLVLTYRVNDGAPRFSHLDFRPDAEVRIQWEWDLSTWDLLPEDRIRYQVDAFDNDAVSGPKKSSSPEFSLRFPSLQELFDEVRDVQDETLDQLEKLSAESAETGEYLEEMRRELLKDETLSWEQQKELETTLAEEVERAQAVEELARSIDEAMTALQESGMATEELLDKMAELRRLMEAVMSPQMQAALAALQEAADSEDPQRLAEALRKFAEDHQIFEERLDRTIALLAQVQAEQRLQAAVKRAEDLEQRQAHINAEMDLGDSRLSQHEMALQQDTESLQTELTELGELMDEYSENTAENLRRQAELMEQQKLAGRMRELTQLLEAPPNSETHRKGSTLEEDLGKLAHNMQNLQGEYAAEQKSALAQAMRAAIHELMRLSERQETVAEVTRRPEEGDEAEIAENQFALAQGTALVVEKLGAVSRRTMSLGYGLSTSLGYAMHHMGRAADLLGRRQRRGTDQQQVAAMGYLNESVMLLRRSMADLADARMPSAFEEAMQQMAGMAEQQSDLNQATQEAFGQQGKEAGARGHANADLRRRMDRLAADQRRLQEALKALERSLRGHRGAEQRARVIEREMETVLQDLQGPRLPKRTLDIQNRILQRMLDASRSIHSRGHENKRKSEAGSAYAYAGPPWLPADRGASEDLLREALRNALAGPYPQEYRRLIRDYYERVYQDLIEAPE